MLQIIMNEDDVKLFDKISEEQPGTVIKTSVIASFDGADMVQLFVEITKFTLPVLASILIANIDRTKSFKYKKDNVEVEIPIEKNFSIEQAMELIKNASDR